MNKRTLLLSCILAFATHSTSPQATATHYEEIKRLEQTAQEEEVQYVDFVFFDINGTLREIMMPLRNALGALQYGLTFDGSSIPGCSEISRSDMHLVPDLSTVTLLPWGDDTQKTARIICDIYLDESTPFEGSPRYVLKQLLEEARQLGFDLYVGPELEFYLFSNTASGTLETVDLDTYCRAECDLSRWGDKKSILNYLQAQNINVEKLHHEVGPGQHELVLHYDNALTIADNILLARHSLTSIAPEADMRVSFMPKPLFGHNGSAMHVHFSLFDLVNKCNAFYNPDNPTELSDIAKHFLAGVLKRIYESTALLNSCINSYKRLIPGFEAPTYICWAKKNRSALVRLPYVQKEQASGIRAELRSPDAASNPYLVFAFILKAGLEGIKNKEILPDPIELNLYKMSQQELDAHGIHSLPHSLEKALEELEKSLFVRELLGEQLFKQFIKTKEQELFEFQQAVTNWEQERYL